MRKKILKIILICILVYPGICLVLLFNPYGRVFGWNVEPHVFFLVTMFCDIVVCTIWILSEVLKERKSRPSENPNECHQYVLVRLEKLGSSFQEQIRKIEIEALPNLPSAFAKEWDNMEHYIKVLFDSAMIDDETKAVLETIVADFAKVAPNAPEYTPAIWTPEAMKVGVFWKEQRNLAKKALRLIKYRKVPLK